MHPLLLTPPLVIALVLSTIALIASALHVLSDWTNDIAYSRTQAARAAGLITISAAGTLGALAGLAWDLGRAMTQHTHGAHAITPSPATHVIIRHAQIPVSADPIAPPAMLQAASAWRTTLRRRDAHPRLRYAGFLVAALATLTAALYAHHAHPPQAETVAVAGRVGR